MDGASAAQRGRFPQLLKYELLEELGHGGMATVYRALDKRLGREVAVKVIHPHLRDSREVVSRFNNEARAVAKLRHANIVEVFDVSDADEPEQYLVVEFVRGTTLRRLLQQHGAMPPEVAAAIALDLLGALAHAHESGVVHRDVKPENVLIEHRPKTASGPGAAVVKLTDFGIAKLLDAQGVTSTGQVLGSPAHMAPEQIEGGEVDARADVFGMGVLLYECMVGHLPFEGSNPAQVLRRVLDGHYAEAQRERPVVGSRWSALLDLALAHAANDRFADAKTMRDAIIAELDRLSFVSPALELEAWLDDPRSYEDAHAKRMIERLCALGNESRKQGAVLAAAGDYNRALNHAPDDPHLLRIVAAMNRAEARARIARRAGAALLLMLGLGATAFGVGRVVRGHATADSPPAPSGATAVMVPPRVSTPPLPLAQSGALPSQAATSVPRPTPPAAPRETVPRVTERTLTLVLQPAMGVKLSIDGDAERDVQTGGQLRIDTKAHSFSFSCEVCGTVKVTVAAGEKDDSLRVVVPIKPATLIITGERDKTYQIVQHPEIPVREGRNDVPLHSGLDHITVKQLETDVERKVDLKAGDTVTAAF